MFNGIDIEKVVLSSFQLSKKESDILTIYDRYELKFSLKTGEEGTITLYVDKGTVPERIPSQYIGQEDKYQEKLREFFLNTLFQRNKKESRIYLGSFNYKDKSKPVNDIYSVSKDGYSSKQELFNALIETLELYENGIITYEELMETFPELDDNQHNKTRNFKNSLDPDNYDEKNDIPKKAKHYVLGDIHGYKEPYETAIKMIKQEDSLVLLGDVIDRGPNGIEILQDLMKRKANTPESNITFILGNHEKMMFEALNYILRFHLSPKTIGDINDYFNASRRQKRIYEYHKETGGGDMKLAEELEKLCTEYKENIARVISEYNIDVAKMIETIGIWCCSKNGGDKTLYAFMNLDISEQKNIFEFLRSAYIMKQQRIQEKDILFVHASPPKDINLVKGLNQSGDNGIRANQLPYDELNFMVWNRNIDTYSQCKELGLHTICGHTYEPNTTIVNRQKGYTCIDEGCGHGASTSVGLYCIEDNTVIHIGQDAIAFESNSTGKIKIIDERGKEETIEGAKIPSEYGR